MSYGSLNPAGAAASVRRAWSVVPLTAALVLLASACGETPTAPHGAQAAPSEAISSGAIGVSPRQLFFLLRDLAPTSFQGSFDASLSPQVSVCLWVDDACQSDALAPVTLGSTGAASLTVNAKRERYIFKWRTRDASLQPNAVYRLMVRVNGLQLGYLDIATGKKMHELRQIDRREFLPLRVGGVVNLSFRIEQGAPIPAGIPGRYESDPGACVDGCMVHATPDNYFSVVWGGVRLGDLGGYGESTVGFTGEWTDPNPVVPPVPAPGSVDIPVTGSWAWRFDDEGNVEIWVDGDEWGHWGAAENGGGYLLPLHPPTLAFYSLTKLPGSIPTP